MTLDAIIFGELGGNSKHNDDIFTNVLNCNRRYAWKMHDVIIIDLIRSAHRIWAYRSEQERGEDDSDQNRNDRAQEAQTEN